MIALLQASSSTKSIPITDDIVINARTQNPEGAWALTQLLCGQDVGVRLGGGTGGVASGLSRSGAEPFRASSIDRLLSGLKG